MIKETRKEIDDMTKRQLINNLRRRENMTLEKATSVVNGIFDDISDEVAAGNDVYIPRFGRFYIGNVSSKRCVHPTTKEDITLPPHPIVRFRMSEGFRRKLS